jgi:transcriptional regulator with XRE-family HTH domain
VELTWQPVFKMWVVLNAVRAGLTQEQQAERVGFTLKYLQRIEAGGKNGSGRPSR